MRDMLRTQIKTELDASNYKYYLHNCYIEKDKCIIIELEFTSYKQDVFNMLWDYSDSFHFIKYENGSCFYLLKFNFDE